MVETAWTAGLPSPFGFVPPQPPEGRKRKDIIVFCSMVHISGGQETAGMNSEFPRGANPASSTPGSLFGAVTDLSVRVAFIKW